jgi:tripartite-type tricarboxylate transporter receptor subunit TctC
MLKYFICVLTMAWSACAWPGEIVRLVVPFAPGTTIDSIARILQEDLSTRLQKKVIVENRAGAGGAIGTKFVAESDSSDTTLLIHSSGLVINAALAEADSSIRSLVPLINLGTAPVVLVASTRSKITHWQDFVKSQNPTIGNSGPNSLTHLISEVVGKDLNKKITPVSYKGVNLALPDLLSGNIDGAFLFSSSALPYIQQNRLVPIAVLSNRRLTELPTVPTLKELKIDSVSAVDPWFAVFCNSKATPGEIEHIKIALQNSLQNPKIISALKNNGINVSAKTALDPGFLLEEYLKYQKMVKKLGLTAS